MKTVTISMPESLKAYIDEQVADEGFGTVSEYLRSLIRDDAKRKTQERLEARLLEGLGSELSPMTREDWQTLRRELGARRGDLSR